MPLYEYECEACGHRFEVIQKFSDPPLEKCPKCGSPVHKLQSAPAFQFKGSGWYITDYARKDTAGNAGKSDAAEKKADAAASSSTSSGDSKSADSAPAASSSETKSAPAKSESKKKGEGRA